MSQSPAAITINVSTRRSKEATILDAIPHILSMPWARSVLSLVTELIQNG
jgi:hypothetical protein